MSFVFNDTGMQQMAFLDSYNTLTDREKSFLKNPGQNILQNIFGLKLMKSQMRFSTVKRIPDPIHR